MTGILDLLPTIGKVLDKVLPDPAAREAAKQKMAELGHAGQLAFLDADVKMFLQRASIVLGEIASSSWLARNWRPLTMLTFVGLIVARWLGWAAPGMSEAEYLSVYDLVKIGLGGYVAGRTVEKITPAVIAAFKNRG